MFSKSRGTVSGVPEKRNDSSLGSISWSPYLRRLPLQKTKLKGFD